MDTPLVQPPYSSETSYGMRYRYYDQEGFSLQDYELQYRENVDVARQRISSCSIHKLQKHCSSFLQHACLCTITRSSSAAYPMLLAYRTWRMQHSLPLSEAYARLLSSIFPSSDRVDVRTVTPSALRYTHVIRCRRALWRFDPPTKQLVVFLALPGHRLFVSSGLQKVVSRGRSAELGWLGVHGFSIAILHRSTGRENPSTLP